MNPAVIVVTGASGSGKTAAVRTLDERALPGVRCYYFDSIGVPSSEEMERDYGSGENWQALKTEQWLKFFGTDPDGADVYVLDGQTRPSFVNTAAERADINLLHIVLLDCAPPVRNRRLIELRGQAELANSQMDCWAAYLRGQADALDLTVIDTTTLSLEAVADALIVQVEKARAELTAVHESFSKRLHMRVWRSERGTPPMNETELNEIVTAWIAAESAKPDSPERQANWWAIERVMFWSLDREGEHLWRFITAAYQRDLSDEVSAILAAGPLEDLLAKQGPEFIERVEELARKAPKFNYLLGGVWRNTMTDDVWQRVQAARHNVW